MKGILDLQAEKELSPFNRFHLRSILLANHLLDVEGSLQNLKETKHLLQTEGFITIAYGYSDADCNEHFLKVLKFLQKNPKILSRFSLPLCDQKIEENILKTLGERVPITNRHVIWAVLSALLCPLRQTIGSCFATAPAILIQSEQMEQFLADMQELLSTGQMKRVIRGVEYSVPICWGPFPLLKIWEYTLASFSDVKTDFARWNLYSSLGLAPEEDNGIGALIYHYLEDKLREANEKVLHFQQEYEIAFDQVRATERLLKNASTEHEMRRLKAEHSSRVYHLHASQEMREIFHNKAKHLSEFFAFFIEKIIENFQEYFQEVYDPELVASTATKYDDSPAGFRLLYKHGRVHVGSWTLIHNEGEYQDALSNFFKAIENSILSACEWEKGHEEISHLITHIVHKVKTEEFLKSALFRMAKAHKQSGQKPWAYISGGTIKTLIKTYFKREADLSEEARWVDSAQDLLIFLLDTLKTLPPSTSKPYLKDPKKRMLMTSPTHAFSLLPGQNPFHFGWEDPGFTYTWVRDHYILPQRHFYERMLLSPSDQIFLMQELAKKLPPMEAYHLQQTFNASEANISPKAFREKISLNPQGLDGFLFEMLPLIQPLDTKTFVKNVPIHPLGRHQLHNLIIQNTSPFQSKDMHAHIAKEMQDRGFAPPKPLIFADTNWENLYLSFITNPATLELELWRTDKNGLTGMPMAEWKKWLDGSSKENWSVYLRPYEYSYH